MRAALVVLAVTLAGGCKQRRSSRPGADTPPATPPTGRADSAPPRAQARAQTQARGPEIALQRGLEALCRMPKASLLHDTALAVAAVARAVPWPTALSDCRHRIIRHGLQDHDHPLSFLIDPGYRSKVNLAHLRNLPPPRPGGRRARVNPIVHRAAHCKAVGFPAATFAYVVGPMRDQGGYHSTHAIWALLLIRDQRCLDDKRVNRAIKSLREELSAAQARHLELRTTRDVDLFAERLLFLAKAGTPWTELEGFTKRLMAAQRADGVFATAGETRLRWKVHATSVAVWALAECLRRRPLRTQKL